MVVVHIFIPLMDLARCHQQPPPRPQLPSHKPHLQLPSTFRLLFSGDEPLWPYYSVLSASAAIDSRLDEVVVHVSIPLMDLGAINSLHRVHNLPIKASRELEMPPVDQTYAMTKYIT